MKNLILWHDVCLTSEWLPMMCLCIAKSTTPCVVIAAQYHYYQSYGALHAGYQFHSWPAESALMRQLQRENHVTVCVPKVRAWTAWTHVLWSLASFLNQMVSFSNNVFLQITRIASSVFAMVIVCTNFPSNRRDNWFWSFVSLYSFDCFCWSTGSSWQPVTCFATFACMLMIFLLYPSSVVYGSKSVMEDSAMSSGCCISIVIYDLISIHVSTIHGNVLAFNCTILYVPGLSFTWCASNNEDNERNPQHFLWNQSIIRRWREETCATNCERETNPIRWVSWTAFCPEATGWSVR